jgi:mono/diheme cytochrome c family protein
MNYWSAILLVTLFTGMFSSSSFSQSDKSNPKDQNARGAKLFSQYCASCHGTDGKGNGPVAASLKTQPSDLTLIQKAGEKFPSDKVSNVINGERVVSPHGTREMPIWGEVFRNRSDVMSEKRDTYTLTKYLESIQKNRK